MAQRKIQFVNREIYHIVVKTVEGIKMFKDKKDYLRMIHNLFEFNDANTLSSSFRTRIYRSKTNVTRKEPVTFINR